MTVPIPKALQPVYGKTREKRPLGTDSPARAEALKWGVIAQIKAEFAGAAKVAGNPIISEAMAWRRDFLAKREPVVPDDGDDPVTLSELLVTRAEEIESAHGAATAQEFFGVATGTATVLDAHLETFLSESTFSPRYNDDIRRAVGRLAAWCARRGTQTTVEAVTPRLAGEFISQGLTALLRDRKTINKDVSALSSYWRWMLRRGHVDRSTPNPWVGQAFDVERSQGAAGEGKERAFTEHEAATLLYGPADQRLRDVMWIAALSGMRLDEVCRLQVRDCAGGIFKVNARRWQTGEGKTNASRRDTPIHSCLVGMISRLSAGKDPNAPLIDGLPAPDPTGKRKPSAAVGQSFTRYRRRMGVDERVEDRRRARVNFHSWKRWFVSTSLRAGSPPHVVSWIAAHEEGRAGMTLGTYDTSGPSTDQLKAAVEGVRPPASAFLPVRAAADAAAEDQSPEE